MAFRFFAIPITASDEPTNALNLFLRTHRIIKVDRQLVQEGTSSLWVLSVEYLDGAAVLEETGRTGAAGPRIDYKEVLSPEDFAIFSRLRDVRGDRVRAESVPVSISFPRSAWERV